jgi:ornithine cyclodeaminase
VIHYAESQLEGLLTLEEAMAGLERAFVERANGAAPVQPRVPTDAGGLRLNTMAAIIPALGVCGAKVYTALNSKFSFVVLLFSAEDGRVLASFDAGALTRLRTAAVSALAVRHLARPESATLAVFGTGTQAAGHAAALAACLPLREILIVGRGRAEAFAREVSAVTGIRTSVSDAAAAVPRADVIVTATRARTPLFDGNAVAAGCCIVAVGSSRPDTAEIDAATLRRCGRIVVECAEQVRHEAGDLIAAAAAGVAVWDSVTELGTILAGRAQGRTSVAEITLFESVGFALEDVAIAALAYSKLNP